MVQDFERISVGMLKSFERSHWSEQADSEVIDNVLAIQGPP